MAGRLIESKASKIIVRVKQHDCQHVQIVVKPENESEFTQVIDLPIKYLTFNTGSGRRHLEIEPLYYELGTYSPRMDENVVTHKVV